MMDNKNNKFQFVEGEEAVEKKVLDDIKKQKNTITVSKKMHFSFEARIILSVFSILVLFMGACFLGFRVINHTTTVQNNYVENANFTYQVCLKDSSCVPESTIHDTDNIDIIKMSFTYDAKYEKKFKNNNSYRVTSVISAYSKKDSTLLYQKNIDLVDKKFFSGNKDNYLVSEVVTIDYAKYKKFFRDYSNATKQVEVVFYVEEKNEIRKVASLLIPISKDNFDVSKYVTSNNQRESKIKVNVWDNYSLIYALATSVLTIISLILIYKTTRLVLKVTGTKNNYEDKINSILKEYDDIIVSVTDPYEPIMEKEVEKVDDFTKLIEVRENIGKPIIFSRVNNVKCEFIVEDDKVLYKYVMKEKDFND